jgi:hypothetical protein
VEDDVEEAGALAADLGAAEACAVLEADAVFFLFEEAFVEFEDLFWWGGWVESRCEDAAGVGLDFVEVTGHEGEPGVTDRERRRLRFRGERLGYRS